MKKLLYVVSLIFLVLISSFVLVYAHQGKEVENSSDVKSIDRTGFDNAERMPDVNHEVHDDQQTYQWLKQNGIEFKGKPLP